MLQSTSHDVKVRTTSAFIATKEHGYLSNTGRLEFECSLNIAT